MRNFICDFGISHPISDQCKCQKKFKVFAAEFRHQINQRYWEWVEQTDRGRTRKVMETPIYSCNITDRMREETLRAIGSEGTFSEAFEILEKRWLA